MQADRISYNGKSDPIICQYAEDYLRKHRRPHIKHAVSNKIRELGRLLIPLQDEFGYDEEKRSFHSASLALHMRASLLGACAAAKCLLLKQDPVLPVTNYQEAIKNIKRFKELVESHWKYAMGSLALRI
nr:unnamed protein product [Callosobruchus analis]